MALSVTKNTGQDAGSGKLVSIQYMRALAVALVVFYHASLAVGWAYNPLKDLSFAAGGVDIFFVVSGFVMFVAARNQKPFDFVRRRIARIVPFYWFMMAFFIALSAFRMYVPPSDTAQIVKSALFLPQINPMTNILQPYIFQGWTLNYEMYFYALFAIGLIFRKPVAVAILLLACLCIGANASPGNDPAVLFARNAIVGEFAAGLLLGNLYTKGVLRPALGWLLPVGFVLLCLSDLLPAPHVKDLILDTQRPLRMGIPAIAIVAGAVALEPFISRHEWRFLTLAGDASYATYLTHLLPVFVYAAIFKILPLSGLRQLTVYLVTVVLICTLIGMLFHVAAERPLIRMAKWIIGPRRRMS